MLVIGGDFAIDYGRVKVGPTQVNGPLVFWYAHMVRRMAPRRRPMGTSMNRLARMAAQRAPSSVVLVAMVVAVVMVLVLVVPLPILLPASLAMVVVLVTVASGGAHLFVLTV